MSKATTFEAWARRNYKGDLIASALYSLREDVSRSDYAWAAMNECEWVRVRVTVETIEEGEA